MLLDALARLLTFFPASRSYNLAAGENSGTPQAWRFVLFVHFAQVIAGGTATATLDGEAYTFTASIAFPIYIGRPVKSLQLAATTAACRFVVIGWPE